MGYELLKLLGLLLKHRNIRELKMLAVVRVAHFGVQIATIKHYRFVLNVAQKLSLFDKGNYRRESILKTKL